MTFPRFASFLIAFSTAPFALASPQATVNVNSDRQFGISEPLFDTLAAINAAGYDAGIDSPLNQEFQVRRQIREELAKRNIPCLPELKEFYKEHKKADPGADLSQYVSFALLAGKAPVFELPSEALPQDAESLRAFSPLLARFYKEANLAELWRRAQPAYASAIVRYQDPVINSLFEANGYVRNPSGYLGRRFDVILDLLGAPNQVQVRDYRDDFFVVITPSQDPAVSEIRDAYLTYLLDPLSFKYSTDIKQKAALEKYAQDAPALDVIYKDDFSLLVTKSLVKAIDARLTHGEDARQKLVNDAMSEGFILTAAFFDLLPAYEKQQESFAVYYPELMAAVDVKKEQKRLKSVQFVQSRPEKIVENAAVLKLPPAEETLQSAEGLYEQERYDDASKLFKKVFEQTTDKSMQGRAYYGLARIAVHMNRPAEAVDLFERTVQDNPNPPISAWAHVYLGRLALAARDAKTASNEFRAALQIDGASAMAKDAAQKGLEKTTSTSGEIKEQ